MTEETTARPVFVYYDHDAEPDELHPSGVLAGTSFESPTPEVAKKFHPQARILRYADGGEYNDRKANAEIRSQDGDEQPAKAAPTRSRASGSSTRRAKPAKVQNDVDAGKTPVEANTGVVDNDALLAAAEMQVAKQAVDENATD